MIIMSAKIKSMDPKVPPEEMDQEAKTRAFRNAVLYPFICGNPGNAVAFIHISNHPDCNLDIMDWMGAWETYCETESNADFRQAWLHMIWKRKHKHNTEKALADIKALISQRI